MGAIASGLIGTGVSSAAPVVEAWPADGGSASAVAAAAVSGWYAVAETDTDTVEIRDVRGDLVRRLTRDDLLGVFPWMSPSAGLDGPSALAFSDSGRLLFIAVHDDEAAPDGFGGDAILRYDTVLDTIAVFTRTELSDVVGSGAGLHAGVSMVHFRGTLYVGTDGSGLQVHSAGKDASFSILPATVPLSGSVRGIAVDRDLANLYAVVDAGTGGGVGDTLLRSSIAGGAVPSFATVGSLAGVAGSGARGVAVATTFGGLVSGDLFVGLADGSGVLRVPALQAVGIQGFSPSVYPAGVGAAVGSVRGVASTACGRLLVAGESGAGVVSESADARLGFEAWLRDEFAQVVAFGMGLISPDGEPAGWVIDADVSAGGARFHPASPDGAAWVVLLLLMDDHLDDHLGATPGNRDLVRSILERYAGLAADGIGPRRNADGIFKHWINPLTGDTQAGWLDEYATLSTMKIVLAADRARRFYPQDAAIVAAADAITDGVTNWGAYIQSGSDALFFQGAAGGGPTGGAAGGFHEGILFIEQASAFGGEDAALASWLDRGRWPTASFATGLSVTTNSPGGHLPSFVSLYSHLVQGPFRASDAWGTHIDHLLGSHGAWTDDNGPRYMTVFSAGDSGDFGGYHADSLSDHPGDFTTLPSLMAFAGDGRTAPAVGAYHAYRRGARQAFEGGASILYRRSALNAGLLPGTAGLPDVALGALGLAELIEAGSVDAVLAGAYGETGCIADLAPPAGVLDLADINAFVTAFVGGGTVADLNGDGVLDLGDIGLFVSAFASGCAASGG